MASLVTIDQAKRHLRIYHSDEDVDVGEKVSQSSDIIIDYIKRPDHGWSDATNGDPPTPSNAPSLIQAAVLLQLGYLWENRGDGEAEFVQADGYLPRAITSILHRFRDPAYA